MTISESKSPRRSLHRLAVSMLASQVMTRLRPTALPRCLPAWLLVVHDTFATSMTPSRAPSLAFVAESSWRVKAITRGARWSCAGRRMDEAEGAAPAARMIDSLQRAVWSALYARTLAAAWHIGPPTLGVEVTDLEDRALVWTRVQEILPEMALSEGSSCLFMAGLLRRYVKISRPTALCTRDPLLVASGRQKRGKQAMICSGEKSVHEQQLGTRTETLSETRARSGRNGVSRYRLVRAERNLCGSQVRSVQAHTANKNWYGSMANSSWNPWQIVRSNVRFRR